MRKTEMIKLLTVASAAHPKMEVSDATVSLWFELLGDLDFPVALAAIKKQILESPFPPTIADIRKRAVQVTAPRQLTGAEAWGEVISAIRGWGSYGEKEAIASLSPTAAKVVRCIGWREICTSEINGVMRGQFMKMYEQVAAREREDVLLPARLQEEIKRLSEGMSMSLITGGKQ